MNKYISNDNQIKAGTWKEIKKSLKKESLKKGLNF